MAPLYRERNVGQSKRDNMVVAGNGVSGLGSPFGELGIEISHSELRETAYEIFVATCRPSVVKPLGCSPQYERSGEKEVSLSPSPSPSPVSFSSTYSPASSSPLQRSLTSSAASTVKKALGLKSSKSPYKDGSPARSSKRPSTVSELVRIQMGISEQKDSQIRRALLRIAAGQIGKQIESTVLPLEFLEQIKASNFFNSEEYEAWKVRNLKVLEAGLLLHPLVPLEENDSAAGRLRQLLKGASDGPTETGKTPEPMQALRSAVMPLACRSLDGYPSDTCHWADGSPLNLMLYQILLESCFDGNDECALIEELNEVLDILKKSWLMLGINQMLHNLCFSWVLFNRFIATGQVENCLLFASESQLAEVARYAKTTRDPSYAKILNSTLSSMLGWIEKRLLAYHDTFQADTIDLMQSTVSLGVSAAKILVEGIPSQYHRKRREEVDVSRSRVEAYIRSSIRTAFAQKMEMVDSSRRPYGNQGNSPPVLAVLAGDVGYLVKYEKKVFSPVLKKWHPLAAGVAAATLHACYGRELKQFISRIAELTPDAVQVLKSADKLEKVLVNIAVEDSVDSDDGGKGIIREMPPYEAESLVASLARKWIKLRAERLGEWVDRNMQQEAWNAGAKKQQFAPSLVEVIRMMDETVEAFFQLPIPMHQDLIPHLVFGLDQGLQQYISKAKSGCGTKSSFIPTLPALTRCTTGSRLGVFKKKEKMPMLQRKKSQVGIMNGGDSFGLSQLCIRMNTLHQICTELEVLERRIISHLRNGKFTDMSVLNGKEAKFEPSLASCHEGIQQLCEATAYRVVFCDLNHLLWEGLYVGEPVSSRVEPLLRELRQNIELVASTVHTQVRVRALTALMKASFDGFLLVLLAGGPYRAFSCRDSQLIEDDFRLLKQLFLVGGDGLPQELVEKAAIPVTNILPLFRLETEDLVERFQHTVAEVYGSSKSQIPLPPTPDNWSPSDPNTVLRVLCHRNDKAAIKFLKKTYALPKKL